MLKRCAWLLLLLLLPSASAAAQAREVAVTFATTGVAGDVVWNFPYDDRWFAGDPTTYNHQLARGSLGLAAAAFRSKAEELAKKDEHVRDFYRRAGFENVQSDQFDVTPAIDTIASAMAYRTIEDEDGPFALVTVAISGSGYRDEWMSNFTIGSARRHEGFDAAAQKVYERAMAYIRAQGLDASRVKVRWPATAVRRRWATWWPRA